MTIVELACIFSIVAIFLTVKWELDNFINTDNERALISVGYF